MEDKRSKNVKIMIITMIMVFSTIITSHARAPKDIKMFIEDTEIVFSKEMGTPFLKNGRTLVPIRVITESMGFDVKYHHNEDRLIVIKNKENILKMKVGKNEASFNEKKINIDENLNVVPELSLNRAYVPIRFVSELFGKEVIWDTGKNYDTVRLISRDASIVNPAVKTETYSFEGKFYPMKSPDLDNKYVKALRDANYSNYHGLSLLKIDENHWVWFYNGDQNSRKIWDVGTVDNLLSEDETMMALQTMEELSQVQFDSVVEGLVKPVDLDGDGKITAVEQRIAGMVHNAEEFSYKGIITFKGEWVSKVIKY